MDLLCRLCMHFLIFGDMIKGRIRPRAMGTGVKVAVFVDDTVRYHFVLYPNLLRRVIPCPVYRKYIVWEAAKNVGRHATLNLPWLCYGPVEENTSQAQEHKICYDSTAILEQKTRDSWEKSKS
jgi:hypothetical protein